MTSRQSGGELWFQTLAGTWEVVGKDQGAGIWSEQIRPVCDTGGPSELTAILRRDASRSWIDLTGDTPVRYMRDGVKHWAGYLRKTPTQQQLADTSINLVCVGLQGHLDDDQYEASYVRARMTDWVDQRSFLSANLAIALANGNVTAGDGGIVLSCANGETYATGEMVGVTLDLGPNTTAAGIVVNWSRIGASDTFFQLYARCDNDNASFYSVGNDAFAPAFTSAGNTAEAGTFPTPGRYVHLFLYRGASVALAADQGAKISSVQVFASTSYEAGGVSVFTGDLAIKDAISKCCPLLDADQSQIAATTVLPEFETGGPKTTRQVWETLSNYEDRTFGVDVDGRPFWLARPTVAKIETRAGFNTTPTDSALIYNRCLVEATGPDGSIIQSSRTSGNQPGAVFDKVSTAQPTNGEFAANISGWTVGVPVTWDGTVGDGGTLGSMKVTTPGTRQDVQAVVTGLTIGRAYQVRWRALSASANNLILSTIGLTATTGIIANGNTGLLPSGVWTTCSLTFVATATAMTLDIDWEGIGAGTLGWIDKVQLYEAHPTVVDRRGFNRTFLLQPSAIQTQTTADALADLWLRNHIRAAFNGTTTVTSGEVTTTLGGDPLRAADLLLQYGQRLRFQDSRDPDTGASHREGLIVKVSYDDDTDTSALELDSETTSWQAFQNRSELNMGASV